MFLSRFELKQLLEDCWTHTINVFTTGQKDDFWTSLLFFGTCSSFSFILSSFLFLNLFCILDYDLKVAVGITGCFGFLMTIALFHSKQVRCYGTLFFISIFMKKSRNLLLTAGTSLVIFQNIRNTLENLTGLTRSLICNFRAKKDAITSPFSNYVKMLKWIGEILKGVTDLGVVNLDSKLKITPKVESEVLRERLAQAEQMLNQTVRYTQAVMSTVSSVSSKMFPAISFLILLTFIMLQVRKYCKNMKYKNKYITSKFVEYDNKRKAEGRPHVLPLTPEEEKKYTKVQFVRPTTKELKTIWKFCVPIATHFVAWTIFITVDAVFYLFVDIVTSKLSEMEPFHIPLIISIKKVASLVGIQLNEENHMTDFSYSITLFEKQCLPKPKLLLVNSIAPLVVILLVLLVMAVMTGKLSHLRLMVCEKFFSTVAEERVVYLHAKILTKRLKTRREKKHSADRTFLQLHFWCPLLFKPKVDGISTEKFQWMLKAQNVSPLFSLSSRSVWQIKR
ncbi:dendritic cell-specific transmembrane protein isoform X2 [Boleophthalmus pectinirostris]|uniref:dendritic cell-specific transmembrane protein isoform X2 n=1 Tax=Boleophthalmus pectinirostris TaxID=150288 RepID=UPI00242B82AD|nr:dendritic cell-specific transmembrane protein isoform X2 [Boleophthalmus pectinirostris]